MRMTCRLSLAFALVIVCLLNIWAAAALYFDLPPEVAPSILVAIFYSAGVMALLFSSRFTWWSVGVGLILFAGVALWWWTIKPSNTRNWQPEVAETAWSERNGEKITIHNLRNFDYLPGQPPVPRWRKATRSSSSPGAIGDLIHG